MRLSSDVKIGLWMGVVALAGAGVLILAPQAFFVGWGMIAVAWIGACYLLWHHVSEFQEWLGKKLSGAASPAAAALPANASNTVKSLDNTVGISWTFLNSPNFITRPDRETVVVQVYGAPNPGATLMPTGIGTGARIPQGWDVSVDKSFYGEVYKCTLKNYGNIGIIQARVMFKFDWQEVIRTRESEYKSGRNLGTQMKHMPILQLGPNEEEFFYITNVGDCFVMASPVPFLEIVRAGSDKWETVRLMSRSDVFPILTLNPPASKIKDLPIESPPTQSPPPPQQGK